MALITMVVIACLDSVIPGLRLHLLPLFALRRKFCVFSLPEITQWHTKKIPHILLMLHPPVAPYHA